MVFSFRRGDRQRLGSAIAAYLEYLNICASSYAHRNGLSNEDARAQSAIARNWLDLDIFSMKKFLEDVIGPWRVPSHRRYLQYFSGLLSGKIKINSHPLYLRFVTIESPPSWLQHEPIALQQAEWRSFIKIYEGLNCVFTSGKWYKHFKLWTNQVQQKVRKSHSFGTIEVFGCNKKRTNNLFKQKPWHFCEEIRLWVKKTVFNKNTLFYQFFFFCKR